MEAIYLTVVNNCVGNLVPYTILNILLESRFDVQ